jgi:glycosyltransferase involved in cell wall biosynthesis
MPSVSVIIPTYNCAPSVGAAIESALRQTYQDFEIVVVDDGSEDNTEQIARRFGKKVAYVKQNQAGPAAARNYGIRISSSKYIAFLDADDIWDPRKLEEQVRVLDEDLEIGLVCSDFAVTSDDGSVSPSYLKDCRHARSGYVFNEVIQENFILTSSVLLRRSCLSEVGMFDEALMRSEDRDLWLRVSYRWKVRILPKPLVVKRNRPDNLMSDPAAFAPFRIRLFEKLIRTTLDLSAHSRRLIRQQLSWNFLDVGYDCFCRDRTRDARKNLWSSLSYNWTNRRALAYLLACYLPVPIIRALRATKQAIF